MRSTTIASGCAAWNVSRAVLDRGEAAYLLAATRIVGRDLHRGWRDLVDGDERCPAAGRLGELSIRVARVEVRIERLRTELRIRLCLLAREDLLDLLLGQILRRIKSRTVREVGRNVRGH